MKTHLAPGVGLLALLLAGALCFSLTACCSGPSPLNIFYGDTIPPWGGTLELGETSFLRVEYEVGPTASGDLLEFYQGDTRVTVPVATTVRDNSTVNGCGESNILHFEIAALEPGRYTVVHRESSGIGQELHCNGCEWGQFQGERAVSFELVVND